MSKLVQITGENKMLMVLFNFCVDMNTHSGHFPTFGNLVRSLPIKLNISHYSISKEGIYTIPCAICVHLQLLT